MSKQLEITLTSGAQTVIDVETWEIRRSEITHQITGFKWTNPEGVIRKLVTLDCDAIAMVVEINYHVRYVPAERPMDSEGFTTGTPL